MYEKVLLALTLLSSLGVLDDATGSTSRGTMQLAQTEVQAQLSAALNNSIHNDGFIKPSALVAHEVSTIPDVPFYSQFDAITSSRWQKVGCGIASLAMLIDYYQPGSVDVDTLLQQGIDAGAYLSTAGWTYKGLINVSGAYGLTGASYDYGASSMDVAFEAFSKAVKKGPVMASVHYTFEPTNPIPHLVIIRAIDNGQVHFNDPALHQAGGEISVSKFKSAWKKRYVEFWPIS